MKNNEIPLGLILIILLMIISSLGLLYYSFLLPDFSIITGSIGILFMILGIGLLTVNNTARIGTIIIYTLAILIDSLIFLYSYGDFTILIRILISVNIIYYLSKPKIKILFKPLETKSFRNNIT